VCVISGLKAKREASENIEINANLVPTQRRAATGATSQNLCQNFIKTSSAVEAKRY
jgi:hypothetical protein